MARVEVNFLARSSRRTQHVLQGAGGVRCFLSSGPHHRAVGLTRQPRTGDQMESRDGGAKAETRRSWRAGDLARAASASRLLVQGLREPFGSSLRFCGGEVAEADDVLGWR